MMVAALAMMLDGAWTIDKDRAVFGPVYVTTSVRGDNAQIEFECAISMAPTLLYRPDSDLGGDGLRKYVLKELTYRFDDGSPERQSWRYRTDYASANSQADAAAFVTQMIGARTLVVRAVRDDNSYVESVFDLTGSAEAFRTTFTACGIQQWRR